MFDFEMGRLLGGKIGAGKGTPLKGVGLGLGGQKLIMCVFSLGDRLRHGHRHDVGMMWVYILSNQ